VSGHELRAVMAGLAPGTGLTPNGKRLRAHPRRVPRFDVTFSVPKSVSVLYGAVPTPGSTTRRPAIESLIRASTAVGTPGGCPWCGCTRIDAGTFPTNRARAGEHENGGGCLHRRDARRSGQRATTYQRRERSIAAAPRNRCFMMVLLWMAAAPAGDVVSRRSRGYPRTRRLFRSPPGYPSNLSEALPRSGDGRRSPAARPLCMYCEGGRARRCASAITHRRAVEEGRLRRHGDARWSSGPWSPPAVERAGVRART